MPLLLAPKKHGALPVSSSSKTTRAQNRKLTLHETDKAKKALAEKGTKEVKKTHPGNKGPYDPHKMREMLEKKNLGAKVESSTLPLPNQKNVKLAGKRHPESRIVFDKRGFPIFDDVAKFDTRIGREFVRVKDHKLHMTEATKSLREQINLGKIDASGFNPKQLKAIEKGKGKIPDLTWHHHQDTGRMQLIPESIHQKTGHIGGMEKWF